MQRKDKERKRGKSENENLLLSEIKLCCDTWIMKSCLEEYRDIGIDEIAEKYIEVI